MTGVAASNVYILNVTGTVSGTRRRLQATPSAAPSSGILAAYQVSVASHYDQSALQSQLAAASSDGFFNQQLTIFAQQFGAAGFVNATSAALIIATASPTAAPVSNPSSSSSSKLSGGAIAGLTIMSFVVVCAIGFAAYYVFMGGSASFKTPDWAKKIPSRTSITRVGKFWQRRTQFDPFQTESESASPPKRRSVVEFVNPSYVAKTNRNEPMREDKDWVDFVNPSFVNQQRAKKPQKEDIASSELDRRNTVEFVNPAHAAKITIPRDPKRDDKDRIDFVNPSFANQPRVKKPKKDDIDVFL